MDTRQIRREATANHLQKVAAVREALARVAPHRPDLEPCYRANTAAVYEQADEVIALLREGPTGSRRRWWLTPPASRCQQEEPRNGPPAKAQLGSDRRVYAVGLGVWRRMWRSVISNSPPPWSRSMRRSAASQRGRSASGTEDHSASARSWAWCSVDQVHAPLSLRVILPTRPPVNATMPSGWGTAASMEASV